MALLQVITFNNIVTSVTSSYNLLFITGRDLHEAHMNGILSRLNNCFLVSVRDDPFINLDSRRSFNKTTGVTSRIDWKYRMNQKKWRQN